jgi:hypothetical protein
MLQAWLPRWQQAIFPWPKPTRKILVFHMGAKSRAVARQICHQDPFPVSIAPGFGRRLKKEPSKKIWV